MLLAAQRRWRLPQVVFRPFPLHLGPTLAATARSAMLLLRRQLLFLRGNRCWTQPLELASNMQIWWWQLEILKPNWAREAQGPSSRVHWRHQQRRLL